MNMTYISKKEKVFDLPQQDEASSISLKKSETRLKRFPSVNDRRAWTSEECQRYQHFYGLVNGSESSISKSSSFKYIPFDVLLAILMAEKDAYIQELLERQDDNGSCCGGKLYKAESFEDSDDDREALIRKDAEVVALKNKIAGLESELEDYRDTLTKAMHKLENMDTILCENNLLKEKLKCSEETIECLEVAKEVLKKELEKFKSKSIDLDSDLQKKQLAENLTRWDGGDCEIVPISLEKDILLQQVEELQKELERAKAVAAEMEILRKISETTSSSLEEISRENDCYKKKLESMKCLEKLIQELKKQAHTLTDKYKRECQKVSDQMKQIKTNAKELEQLVEERNKLEERVNELATYESQYFSLEAKLHQVEIIIDENEILNKKLIQLDRLEMENQQLKIKINHLKSAEIQVVEDKEKIMQLQCALVDQEEEMRKMLRQIEDLSQGYIDKNEIYRMRNELEEKNGKLKIYEKQLCEIPILESEIDGLKNKLQKCIDDFKTDKNLLTRLQDELEACRKRCHELEQIASTSNQNIESRNEAELFLDFKNFGQTFKIDMIDKEENTMTTSKRDMATQPMVIECKKQNAETLIDDLGFDKLKELEIRNASLKNEVESLQSQLSQVDLNDLINQTKDMQNLLNVKENKILQLESEIDRLRKEAENIELKQTLCNLKDRAQLLDVKLQEEFNLRSKLSNQLQETEINLKKEKKAREFAMEMAKDLEDKLENEGRLKKVISKLHTEEINAVKQEIFIWFSDNIDKLKDCNRLLEILVKELKVENKILRENFEKKAMKDMIRKLKSEIKVLKSLSKPELQNECTILHEKVKKLLEETDSLVEEIVALKSALESEKTEKDYLEKELTNLQAELSACVAAGNDVINREIANKERLILSLEKDLEIFKKDLENSWKEAEDLKEKNMSLSKNYNAVKCQQNDLEQELNCLHTQIKELNNTIEAQKEQQRQQLEEINNCREIICALKNDSAKSKELADDFHAKFEQLKDLLRLKEDEIKKLVQKSLEMKSDLNKVNSEMEVLKSRFQEKGVECYSDKNFEKDLEEKYALEEALRKMEGELDQLKVKLEDYKKMEEEMTVLKKQGEILVEKISDYKKEIETLKKKLDNSEIFKNELEKEESDMAKVFEELRSQTEEIESLKLENENLKGELTKSENLLDVCKKLQKTIPQGGQTSEFFTPPAILSPHPSDPHEDSDVIPVEVHNKEMTDLEARLRLEIENLNELNREKLKKLMMHHEKEMKCRSKAFHESINGIKSSYESDIRRLVEKHKGSIMRLQGLHEDEVQELNTNYETQMEAMQTQNENLINDLRTECAEKCKNLREQHDRELEAVEEKYAELLRKREAQFLTSKTNEDSNVTQNDVQEVHKKDVENLTQFYQSSILELEEKHNEEIKKCKKNNLKKIEQMENKYEALLEEERKKYEEHLEEMLLRLKNGQRGDSEKTARNPFEHKISTPSPRLEFVEVLRKIINEGLESLTFEELILVHSKTCFVPGNLEECPEEGILNPGIGDGCKHRSLMAAEKEQLLKRIFTLEHEIIIKQLETHEATNMEIAEKCRVQDLKNALFTAQQKNLELKRLLSNQSEVQMGLKIERYMLDRQASLNETNVMEKVKELEREKAEKKRLEEELEKEKANVKHLTATLEIEKERFGSQRKRDSDYVKSIRLRLEEALNHEQMMETQLDYEARFRSKLEAELQALQRSFNLIAEVTPGQLPVETKVLKNSKNLDKCDLTKQLHCKNKIRHRNKSKNLQNNVKSLS